jgi:hypothetical protein
MKEKLNVRVREKVINDLDNRVKERKKEEEIMTDISGRESYCN